MRSHVPMQNDIIQERKVKGEGKFLKIEVTSIDFLRQENFFIRRIKTLKLGFSFVTNIPYVNTRTYICYCTFLSRFSVLKIHG